MVKKLIRKATRTVYKKVAKPRLFRKHPDGVHSNLLHRADSIQKVPLLAQLPMLWAYRSARLHQTICGVRFENPIGLSAGFDKNIVIADMIYSIGFGFMVGGSISAKPCDGNPRPWFHRLPEISSIVVNAGLPNEGVDVIVERLSSRQRSSPFPLVISVAKTNSPETVGTAAGIADYCESLTKLQQIDAAQMYELNISCPNVHGGEPFTTPDELDQLLSAVDQVKLSRPLFVKMPIDKPWEEFEQLLAVIVRHNVQGVNIGNLRKDRSDIDPEIGLTDDIRGNLSGLPTQQVSTDLIFRTYAAYGDKLVIIGTGGVFSARDAYEKIRAGASLVGLITGMIYEGPQLIGDINEELDQLLARDHLDSISQAVGAAHRT